MKYSFNLIDQPWIPCVLPDGRTEELSLRDTLLNAHEITAIFDQSPLVTAALHRLLLAILHRNFGPASRNEWKALWQASHFDENKLNDYFATWHHRFELFDEDRPFYQVIEFPSGNKIIAINEILSELSKQNTAAWFDHSTYENAPDLTLPEAARALITIQSYKLAGTFIPPKLSYTDAPTARAIYFLITGGNLFETLLFNLVRYCDDIPIPKVGDDLPIWEQAKPSIATIPNGYVDYLTWQTLVLRLLPQETVQGEAKVAKIQIALGRLLDPPAPIFDPGCIYIKNTQPKAKVPWLSLRFEQDRSLWRDSSTLFRLSSRPKGHFSALGWVANLVNDDILRAGAQYQIAGHGLCADQQKIFLWRHDRVPLPAQYLSNEGLVEQLEIALQHAEDAARALQQASVLLARRLLYPNRQGTGLAKAQAEEAGRFARHLAITEKYWSALETPFFRTIRTLPDAPDDTLGDWLNTIRNTAFSAFDQTTRALDQSARTLQAVTNSREFLTQKLRYLSEPQA